MNRFRIVKHPLLDVRMTELRDKKAEKNLFNAALHQVSLILAMEAARLMKTVSHKIETPMESFEGAKLKQSVVVVPVLRAGLGMLDSFTMVFPEVRVGHLGVVRNEETLQPKVYLKKLPSKLDSSLVILLDPMLATGGTASVCLDLLKKEGARHLVLVSCIAAPEGVKKVSDDHPDVDILTAALDRELNEQGYILPGLGDAGDRQFGTV